MMSPPTKQEVINAIHGAFHGVAREDGVTLHEAHVIDEYGGNEERAAARMLDTEQAWEKVPDTDIENYDEILSFLDPKGFRYYIPAYMNWTVRAYSISGSASIDSTLFHLDKLDDAEDYHRSRLDLLNETQRAAIALFLLYISTEHSDPLVPDAILRFWRRYLPPEHQI